MPGYEDELKRKGKELKTSIYDELIDKRALALAESKKNLASKEALFNTAQKNYDNSWFTLGDFFGVKQHLNDAKEDVESGKGDVKIAEAALADIRAKQIQYDLEEKNAMPDIDGVRDEAALVVVGRDAAQQAKTDASNLAASIKAAHEKIESIVSDINAKLALNVSEEVLSEINQELNSVKNSVAEIKKIDDRIPEAAEEKGARSAVDELEDALNAADERYEGLRALNEVVVPKTVKAPHPSFIASAQQNPAPKPPKFNMHMVTSKDFGFTDERVQVESFANNLPKIGEHKPSERTVVEGGASNVGGSYDRIHLDEGHVIQSHRVFKSNLADPTKITGIGILKQEPCGRVTDMSVGVLKVDELALVALKQAQMLLTNYKAADGDIIIRGGSADQANRVFAALLLLMPNRPELANVKIKSFVTGCTGPQSGWLSGWTISGRNRSFIETHLGEKVADGERLRDQVMKFKAELNEQKEPNEVIDPNPAPNNGPRN